MLTRYANLVAFKLWQGEVCICYAEYVTLFIINTLKISNAFLLSLLEDRLPLKVPTHKGKLKKFLYVPMP